MIGNTSRKAFMSNVVAYLVSGLVTLYRGDRKMLGLVTKDG
jgi:hypothetical protein